MSIMSESTQIIFLEAEPPRCPTGNPLATAVLTLRDQATLIKPARRAEKLLEFLGADSK